jgi:hypothetical protein
MVAMTTGESDAPRARLLACTPAVKPSPAGSTSKQTPLKHERVSICAESPPDAALAYNSSSPGAGGTGSSAFSAGDGTPRLKLKLVASHPALAQLIERCGFNALLQLTFKPGGKSMGR